MLELAILGFLHEEPLHGYELKQRIRTLTGHFRPVSDGALYPAIARLEHAGFLVRRQEPGAVAAPRQVLLLTPVGEEELRARLNQPSDLDISDRNHFFTLLAFLSILKPEEQRQVLLRRLEFLQGGRSFFQKNGKPVYQSEETDPYRLGMLHIARATTQVEQAWLKEMVDKLEG